MKEFFKYAGVAGILSLIMVIPEIVFGVLIAANLLTSTLIPLYILVLLLSLIFYCVFTYGFTLIGKTYKSTLLRILSYALIIYSTIYYAYLIFVLIYPNFDNKLINIMTLIPYGIIGIPYGIALIKLKPYFGALATWVGILEIVVGIFLLSVILSFFGLLLCFPLYILSSIMLFEAAKKAA